MRKAAPVHWAIVACALHGCSTMKTANERYPGVVDRNPNAVTRVYPASATRVAWAMTQVMMNDPILDDVRLMVDPQSNESRSLSRSEREKLGVGIARRDVDYDIRAKSKDGHPVGAVVQLKGDSAAEVTLLYGVAGDPELSRSIFERVGAALDGPARDPGLWKASDARPARPRPPAQ